MGLLVPKLYDITTGDGRNCANEIFIAIASREYNDTCFHTVC